MLLYFIDVDSGVIASSEGKCQATYNYLNGIGGISRKGNHVGQRSAGTYQCGARSYSDTIYPHLCAAQQRHQRGPHTVRYTVNARGIYSERCAIRFADCGANYEFCMIEWYGRINANGYATVIPIK